MATALCYYDNYEQYLFINEHITPYATTQAIEKEFVNIGGIRIDQYV